MPLYEFCGASPHFDPTTVWIAPSAQVIGDVRLGDRASVWFEAVIRGDNTAIVIGEGTNIQDGAILHSDPGEPLTIGRACVVGHRAVLHGCTVADNVLIGIGAIVLNGAVIGDNCLVGAGALVSAGRSFPANSLILGSPAKVVRSLSPAEIAEITALAHDYAEKSLRFRAQTGATGAPPV